MCNGQCCTNSAGLYIPEDFKEPITSELLTSLLNSGKISIDWWEGDFRIRNKVYKSPYFLRPRHKGEPAIKGSWGGTCINYTDGKGCSLSKKDRPFQCRKLVPNFNFETNEQNCTYKPKDKAGKKDCISKWCKYQKELSDVVNNYVEK